MRDLILQLSKSSIYSTKPAAAPLSPGGLTVYTHCYKKRRRQAI
jgi:hypothetical protein